MIESEEQARRIGEQMPRATAKKSDEALTDTLERVTQRKERVVVRQGRKNVAALVPMEDLALLEELEDLLDAREAARRLADPREKPIPYEQVRKELGLA
jgi:PHD/YefM family antitoxin component YafN of YafNO toxin-antitoxin module